MQRPVDEQGGTTSAEEPPPRASRGLSWVILPVVAFAGLVALFAFALTSGDPSRLPSALIGKPVPAMEFPPLEGLLEAGHPVPGFTSADLKGGVSVVNFWAAWCTECAGEQELLLELKARAGVPIYGVNYKDDAVAARRFLGRYGNPFKAVGTDKARAQRDRVGRLWHARDVRDQRQGRDRLQARRRRHAREPRDEAPPRNRQARAASARRVGSRN